MAKQLNHKCIVCGKLYHSCDSCERIKSYSPWRTITDSFNHYQIYVTIKSFDSNIISQEEAIQELRDLGVTESTYKDWPEGTQKKLDTIFKTPYPQIESKYLSTIELVEETVETPFVDEDIEIENESEE